MRSLKNVSVILKPSDLAEFDPSYLDTYSIFTPWPLRQGYKVAKTALVLGKFEDCISIARRDSNLWPQGLRETWPPSFSFCRGSTLSPSTSSESCEQKTGSLLFSGSCSGSDSGPGPGLVSKTSRVLRRSWKAKDTWSWSETFPGLF